MFSYWARRDSYLPQGSHGLKAVTKYKLGEFFFVFVFFAHFYFPASGQAVVTGVVPSPPPVLAFNFYRA